jgi:hypothetical protein
LSHAVLFLIASVFFFAVLIYGMHGHQSGDNKVFIQRVLATYSVTFLIGAALLFGVDRLDLFTDPLTGLKRPYSSLFLPASPQLSPTVLVPEVLQIAVDRAIPEVRTAWLRTS